MIQEAAGYLHGVVPNASGTPRDEVGGLALFDGVLMRSRTGFAIALRRPDGSIAVTQVPYSSLLSRSRVMKLPVVRGAGALADMMAVGTRALRFSTEQSPEVLRPGATQSDARFALLLAASAALMVLLMVALPSAIAEGIGRLPGIGVWLNSGPLSFTEADRPLAFNIVSGCVRLAILVGYVIAISSSAEIRDVFRYHGAEHAAVSAFEGGRDVTVARALRQPIVHPRCGTTFLALMAIASVPAFAFADHMLSLYVSGFPDWPLWQRKVLQLAAHAASLPLLVGAGFELFKACSRRAANPICRAVLMPGLLLQRLTTRKPTAKHAEVAIVALFAALDIAPWMRAIESHTVRGLEHDDSAPGYVPRSPARAAEADPVTG